MIVFPLFFVDSSSPAIQEDRELEQLVDSVLTDLDVNNDGYVTYSEFQAMK